MGYVRYVCASISAAVGSPGPHGPHVHPLARDRSRLLGHGEFGRLSKATRPGGATRGPRLPPRKVPVRPYGYRTPAAEGGRSEDPLPPPSLNGASWSTSGDSLIGARATQNFKVKTPLLRSIGVLSPLISFSR